MTNTTEITNRINSFNFHWGQTSDTKKFDAGLREENDICKVLSTLSVEELREVKTGITATEKFVSLAFGEFLDNLPTPVIEVEKSELSKLMSAAWKMIRKGLFTTISEALKAAWKRAKLIKQLTNGVAYFTYAKATGELRDAIGTLRNGNYAYEYKTNGKGSKVEVIKYFDLQAKAWRSCRSIDRSVTKTIIVAVLTNCYESYNFLTTNLTHNDYQCKHCFSAS